jgi:N-formylglutamate deformylase
MDIFTLRRGTAPLLISLPHDGAELPPEIAHRLTPTAARAPDTDWFVSALYSFATELGASILQPHYSRYVVDLNRPPDGASLYPGQNTTGLCPVVQFSGEPIYLSGQEPDRDEIAQRVDTYWRPYHDALSGELERLHAQRGRVVLWEGHSIRSQVPYLFEGRLPDFNLGTADGASCSAELRARLTAALGAQQRYSFVVDGRFKGGYITRHYGRPNAHCDAVQLELAQCNYMDEARVVYDAEKAAPVQALIREMLAACLS